MNLPQQKDLPSMQQACQGQDVEIEKAVTDSILASPLHSLITSERKFFPSILAAVNTFKMERQYSLKEDVIKFVYIHTLSLLYV